MEIRSAQPSDLSIAKAWLQKSGLPTADLTETHMQDFLVAEEAATPVGMIGVEEYTDCGLLRSLIVDESFRGSGVGASLVAALEARSAERGLRMLWLLTIDADPFFTILGYSEVPRGEAPPAVQNSAEFSSLCPGDAVLMCKRLSGG